MAWMIKLIVMVIIGLAILKFFSPAKAQEAIEIINNSVDATTDKAIVIKDEVVEKID